jgi:hypothetical protein
VDYSDARSPSRVKSAAPYQRQGFVGCRSCGCFSMMMPLASMVRTLVSLVDVPDANSLRALAGTPFNILDSAAYSQHARVLRTSGTDIGEPALNRLFHVSCCGSSVSMRGYSLRGCIDEQECRKTTDDCNLRFDVGPAVEEVTPCGRSLVYPPIWRCVRRLIRCRKSCHNLCGIYIWNDLSRYLLSGIRPPARHGQSGSHLPQSGVPHRLPTERDLG